MPINQKIKMNLKVCAISSLLVVSLAPNVAHAGGWAITPAVGYEEVTVPTAGLKFGVNLYGVVGRYHFDNGVLLGASAQLGYPDNPRISNEGRYEGIFGYRKRINNFSPYIVGSLGSRNITNRGNYGYYTATAGVKYDFNKKVFADVSYRYRNTTSDELKWEANTVFVGVGYHINPTTTANIIYGNTFSGDYTSNSYTFALTKKFN
jgi:opacity protein-like surface antigen